MSAMNDTFLARMQAELVALLKSDAVLGALPILDERKGAIAEDVQTGLGVLNSVGGKYGAVIIVQSPIADDEMPAAAGGALETQWTFLVLEDPLVNDDAASGHQIPALQICRRIVRVVKLYAAGGLATSMIPEKKGTISPIGNPVAPVAYEVRFHCTEVGQGTNAKVMTPTIAPNGGATPQTVTITCGTAGAQIYYTTDGSHPWSGNTAATLYAAPFEVTEACEVRARAFKTDFIGSNAAAQLFT